MALIIINSEEKYKLQTMETGGASRNRTNNK